MVPTFVHTSEAVPLTLATKIRKSRQNPIQRLPQVSKLLVRIVEILS